MRTSMVHCSKTIARALLQCSTPGLLAVTLGAGCAETKQETRPAPQAVEEAPPPPASTAISMEKLDEINSFFRSKSDQLQYRCYSAEMERSGNRKLEGSLAVSLVVEPGGKASDVKVTRSSLGSPEIEKCVVEEVSGWSWPDVPGPAPYQGAVSFKPAY